MKAYIATTGAIFGLLTVAHIWRIVEEGSHVANAAFILITLASGAMCLWAWRVLTLSGR
jgi:hypothetical protein